VSRCRTALIAVGSICASLLPALVVTAAPARASVAVNEAYPVPAGGVYPIEGHGWGHGRGMSQYGALGAASKAGKTADQITAFYYPGTAKGFLSNAYLRVKLSADTDSATEVYAPASGTALTVTDLATGRKAVLPISSTVTRWRSRTASDGLHLDQRVSGVWKPYTTSAWAAVHAGPLQFSGPTTIRVAITPIPGVGSVAYRGVIRSLRVSATQIMTVNVLPMESYLRGVVPRESPSGWAQAALQAQAIAARSYTQYKREHIKSGQYWHICDTTACQVYGGYASYATDGTRRYGEEASTSLAVKDTAGVIRTYGGKAIFAEFSSSNGGWSTAAIDPTRFPYLKAQRDDWDGLTGSSVHSWRASVSAGQIQKAFPAIGTLRRLRVIERDGNGEWRGRVRKVALDGVNSAGQVTSLTVTGRDIYLANVWPASSNGMRSSWWHVLPSFNSQVVSKSSAPRLVRSPGVSTGVLTATLKNVGTATWPTSGLHLAVSSPPGQADPLVGNSTKPGLYTGTATSIAPGASAAFRFSLTGNAVPPGLHARSYRLRIGSGAVFGTLVSYQVPVDAPVYSGTQVGAPVSTSGTAPTGEAPGPVLADGRSIVVPVRGSTPLSVRVKNTGNITWPVTAGGPVRLGTSSPLNRVSASSGSSWLVAGTRPSAVRASAPVAPGQSGTFGLTLYGNSKPVGATTEVFQPLWHGKSWFKAPTTSLSVVRVNPAVSRLASATRVPPSSLSLTNAPTGTATLVVRLQNLGGSRWAVGSEALRASSASLATSAWSSTTPPRLRRNATRPGISSVYPGEVGEWLVPISSYKKAAGTYPLTLQAVSGGVSYGPRMSTTVTVVAATFSGSLVTKAGTIRVASVGSAVTFFDVKNTGNARWPVNGMLRSRTLTATSSWDPSWLASNRPGPVTANLTRPGASDVRAGEVARFSFRIAGNGRVAQTTAESFGIVWDGWKFLSGFTVPLSYQIV